MTQKEHHMLTLGVLAGIHRKHNMTSDETWLSKEDATAIEHIVESAENIGLPVSVEQLRKGLPIGKET